MLDRLENLDFFDQPMSLACKSIDVWKEYAVILKKKKLVQQHQPDTLQFVVELSFMCS